MQKNTSFVIVVFGTTLLCAGLFMTTIVHSFFYAPEEEVSASPSQYTREDFPVSSSTVPQGVKPVRLLIPSLHISAKVQDVGIGKSGNMAVPSNFTDVGWYRYGPIPGNRGSAVIAGHMDNAMAMDGVFRHLSELLPGNRITVLMDDASKVDFVVTAVETYPYDNVPIETIFRKKDGAYLNLVTCGGTWIQEKKSYDHRVVVYSQRASA